MKARGDRRHVHRSRRLVTSRGLRLRSRRRGAASRTRRWSSARRGPARSWRVASSPARTWARARSSSTRPRSVATPSASSRSLASRSNATASAASVATMPSTASPDRECIGGVSVSRQVPIRLGLVTPAELHQGAHEVGEPLDERVDVVAAHQLHPRRAVRVTASSSRPSRIASTPRSRLQAEVVLGLRIGSPEFHGLVEDLLASLEPALMHQRPGEAVQSHPQQRSGLHRSRFLDRFPLVAFGLAHVPDDRGVVAEAAEQPADVRAHARLASELQALEQEVARSREVRRPRLDGRRVVVVQAHQHVEIAARRRQAAGLLDRGDRLVATCEHRHGDREVHRGLGERDGGVDPRWRSRSHGAARARRRSRVPRRQRTQPLMRRASASSGLSPSGSRASMAASRSVQIASSSPCSNAMMPRRVRAYPSLRRSPADRASASSSRTDGSAPVAVITSRYTSFVLSRRIAIRSLVEASAASASSSAWRSQRWASAGCHSAEARRPPRVPTRTPVGPPPAARDRSRRAPRGSARPRAGGSRSARRSRRPGRRRARRPMRRPPRAWSRAATSAASRRRRRASSE